MTCFQHKLFGAINYLILCFSEPGEFLESDRGKCYLNLFQSLRLNHVINDQSAVRHLERDKIVPTGKLIVQVFDVHILINRNRSSPRKSNKGK